MPEASVKTSKMSNEMQEFALSTANDAIKNQWNEQVLLVISMREKKKKNPFGAIPFENCTLTCTHTNI